VDRKEKPGMEPGFSFGAASWFWGMNPVWSWLPVCLERLLVIECYPARGLGLPWLGAKA